MKGVFRKNSEHRRDRERIQDEPRSAFFCGGHTHPPINRNVDTRKVHTVHYVYVMYLVQSSKITEVPPKQCFHHT